MNDLAATAAAAAVVAAPFWVPVLIITTRDKYRATKPDRDYRNQQHRARLVGDRRAQINRKHPKG
jgi:hypothetical protein